MGNETAASPAGPGPAGATAPPWWRRLPVGRGLLPVDRARVPAELLAGVTLAALAIPETMGYATIAGMPVITGLYTILVPLLAFALLGSSRHLVVGADSATAAVIAASLVTMAAAGSKQYVALAGTVALLAGVLLVLARIVRLGFLADFLSRTVLVGFLTGVGIQVAAGQLSGMLGISAPVGFTVDGHRFTGIVAKVASTFGHLDDASWATIAVSASVIVVIVFGKRVVKAIPAALIAVVGAIVVSWAADLAAHGVADVGPVPGGLPSVALPHVGWSQAVELLGTAASVFVLILAQSAATARAYAARNDETLVENLDLVALGVANLGAAVTGTFVVNGSPTKTEMVTTAGGRTQLAQVTTVVVVGLVLLFLTGPIQYLPKAVLASVVFLIGIELVDVAGLRAILAMRPDEFVVAVLTGATVVFLGVEQGIVLAVVASVIIHLRRSYRPLVSLMVPRTNEDGWHGVAPAPGLRSGPGLLVLRFASDLYYANAEYLRESVLAAVAVGEPGATPLRRVALDCSAVTDVDFTGAQVLRQLHGELNRRHLALEFVQVIHTVRAQLTRFGLVELVGADALFDSLGDVVRAAAAAEGRDPPAS